MTQLSKCFHLRQHLFTLCLARVSTTARIVLTENRVKYHRNSVASDVETQDEIVAGLLFFTQFISYSR